MHTKVPQSHVIYSNNTNIISKVKQFMQNNKLQFAFVTIIYLHFVQLFALHQLVLRECILLLLFLFGGKMNLN